MRMGPRLLPVAALLGGLVAATLAGVPPLAAQDPPPPDTIPVPPRPDTLPRPTPTDTLPGLPEGDTIPETEGDTLLFGEPAEIRPVRNLATPGAHLPEGWGRGVWVWDREALLATRALTLLELLELIPGIVPLRGGDYGQPSSVTAFGMGPGEVRVFLNGAELAPLDAGVVDLSQVGLGALSEVRVERRSGELRIELTGFRITDGRIYSLLEVGTGDLNTNLFRGTFAHPAAFGGNLVLTLDRMDTEGPFRQETGVQAGVQLRYDLFLRDESGISVDWRQMSARRPSEFWAPAQVNRRDLAIRGRHELPWGVRTEVYLHRSGAGLDEDRSGAGADTLVSTDTRREVGTRLSWGDARLWTLGEGRFRSGEGWPERNLELRGGGALPRVGGLSAGVRRDTWNERSVTGYHARAWTEPRAGLSLFGELESGRRGIPVPIPIRPEIEEEEGNGNGNGNGEDDPEDPFLPSFMERTGYRGGVEFSRSGVYLTAAFLSQEVDSLFPHGIGMERGEALPQVGGSRTGFEVAGTLPLNRVLNGLSLVGHAQLWNENGEAWRYLPRENHEVRLRFHNVFLESRNLEVWTDIGRRSRGEMAVPLPLETGDGFRTVPENGRWFGRLQIRVLDVHVFVVWDNFTYRDENQDYPERFLPVSRALYGVRWTLWN